MTRRVFSALLLALGGTVALLLDWQVMLRRLHERASLVPGDLAEFRAYAFALFHTHDPTATAASGLPYPPPFVLLAAPLDWVTPLSGYVLWLLFGNLALAAAARRAGLTWAAVALGLLSPPNLYCMAMGQTGAFVSALLLAALSLTPRQPFAAGLAAAGIVIKPHFGLLMPICFLAARQYRAVLAAAFGLLILCLLPLALVDPQIWTVFLFDNSSHATRLVTQAWPQPYQYVMVTVFMMLRSLGGGMAASYGAQAIATAAAAAGCWQLWRATAQDDGFARLSATLCLVALATPYAYIYDLVALGFGLAGYAATRNWAATAPLAIFWLFTGLYGLLSMGLFLTGALFLALIAWLVWPRQRQSSASNSAICS